MAEKQCVGGVSTAVTQPLLYRIDLLTQDKHFDELSVSGDYDINNFDNSSEDQSS
jgi:hypothetical protein